MEIDFKRKETLIIIFLITALVFGLGYTMAENPMSSPYDESLAVNVEEEPGDSGEDKPQIAQEEKAVNTHVYVHVIGAVAKPGLYCLVEGARVADALQEAKPLPEADLDAINLAEIIFDQQQIFLPRKGESQNIPPNKSNPVKTAKSGKVNINSASLQELDTLPGIGAAYAQRIIDYRTNHGGFKSIEEIKKVSGIGEKKFNTIKDLITI